ncbi:glycosyltransferase family 39 protein [Sporomusa sp.]|uniref:ArnT family glycosyltransferase n=1 Tax=Sporomusa sp. TaxID=2078658 RepID=UPI002C9CCFE7|nr:glycosyltransferase family 39 protein [Sporomusa sp.]HWR43776.1 glycosyltransferase family 39 protein [Sporomusa sp.]
MKKNTWIEVITVILVAGFIMLFQLGELPLLDPDEPVYAQTAREMLAANDLISPRIFGDFWYDKPPMYYWLVAGAFKVFGQTEVAARLPSACLAVFGALMVYMGGKSIINNRAGFIAALVLSTSLEYFYLGKAAVTDVTLTFFITACLLLYLRKKYYLAYVAAGLAVLTKGPIGIVFPVAIILIHLILTRNLGSLRYMKIFSGGALVLAVALPWYLAMFHFHGMDFVNTFLGFHNVTRFLQPEHSSGTLWYYYIPVLLLGFFPWTIFLVQSVWAALQNRDSEQGSELVFFVIWAMVVFAFFTVSQTKLISYILPMYPPLALLVGWYIDRCLTVGTLGIFRKPAVILTILMICLEAGLFITAKNSIPDLFPGAVMTGLVFALALGAAWFTVRKGRNAEFIGVLVAGMTAFVIVLMIQLLPAAAQSFSVKALAGQFREHYDGQAPVYIAKFYRPGFSYYTGTPGRELTTNQQFKELVLSDSGKAYFIIRKTTYLDLPPGEQSKLQLVATQKDVALVLKN